MHEVNEKVFGDSSWVYGMQLPIQTLTRTLVDPWEDDATVDDLVEIAQRAEATGHRFVGVCDHVAIPDDDYASRMTTTWYDTVATLGFLAANTSTVNLLSVIYVAGYRHPLQTAKAFGTIDHLSGGRAILGIGAGHVENEFKALGVDFADRGGLLDETLDALHGVWDDTYVSFQGKRYRYDDVGVAPRPTGGALPLWVGGSGRRAWQRAGRLADGYIPMGNAVTQYPEIVETIRQAATDAGRDPDLAIGFMPGWAYLTGQAPDDLPPAINIGAEALAGEMRAARDAGANTMHVKFRSRTKGEYLEQLDAFVETVVPLVDEP
jgi:probable F420-dependent oxidoreductase